MFYIRFPTYPGHVPCQLLVLVTTYILIGWKMFTKQKVLLVWLILHSINSLAPGKFELNFRYLIFQIILVIDGWGIPCELALRWMSLDLTDDKSTLVQVMAWCRQATSHYLSRCWLRPVSPYGVTRPQWVKNLYTKYVYIYIYIYTHTHTHQWLLFESTQGMKPTVNYHKPQKAQHPWYPS